MEKTENLKSKKNSNMSFFKRFKISIVEFDKYYQISAESFGKTILYLLELLFIFSIVVSLCLAYKLPEMIGNNDSMQEVINFLNNYSNSYFISFIYIFIAFYITYFIAMIIDVFALSLLGMIICKLVKLPLTYSSVFSISASSITLSIVLSLIYILANIFFKFEMKQFQVMITIISYIYLIVSILSFRANILKIEKEEGKA